MQPAALEEEDQTMCDSSFRRWLRLRVRGEIQRRARLLAATLISLAQQLLLLRASCS